MGQTKKMSAVESLCDVTSGFIVAMMVWRFIVTPWLGIPISYGTNLQVTGIFTIVSITRKYVWRRFFNGRGK